MAIVKVVSGGQTGADRGALDAARACGVAIGGWIPAGRRAEDGRLPDDYPLQETASADPAERTRLNVRDSDATLIVSHGPLRGGSDLTSREAASLGRPYLHVDLATMAMAAAIDATVAWVSANNVAILNVAGPRQSEDPHAYVAAAIIVGGLLSRG